MKAAEFKLGSAHWTTQAAPKRQALRALMLLWVAYAVLILSPGNLIITSHWGDALHLVDILERMALGAKPHQDFVTPIGALAFWPIAMLKEAGLSTARAYLITQLFLAGIMSASALAIASRRMTWGCALAFAVGIMVTTLALTHGRPEFSLSINVHYNRWAWAIAHVGLLAALLPARRFCALDGIMIGLAMACLALLKVTFFVAFLPLVTLGLILTGQIRLLPIAATTGLAIACVLTAWWGIDYWRAYVSDILYVAGGDARPNAGAGLLPMITGPYMLAPTSLVGLAVVLLFRGGLHGPALLMVCTFLAGAFVSDQNAGHDPLFLGLLAFLILVWAQKLIHETRVVLTFVAVGLFLSIAPNLVNLATSPLRAVLADQSSFAPLLTGRGRHQDILLTSDYAMALGETYFGKDAYQAGSVAQPKFKNEHVLDCQSLISPAYFASIADDLARNSLAQGQPIFVADYLSPLWLFGDHPPLKGAAPWSYGGLRGIENAAFVLVPVCANRPSVHRRMLPLLAETRMTERRRTAMYRLFELESHNQP